MAQSFYRWIMAHLAWLETSARSSTWRAAGWRREGDGRAAARGWREVGLVSAAPGRRDERTMARGLRRECDRKAQGKARAEKGMAGKARIAEKSAGTDG